MYPSAFSLPARPMASSHRRGRSDICGSHSSRSRSSSRCGGGRNGDGAGDDEDFLCEHLAGGPRRLSIRFMLTLASLLSGCLLFVFLANNERTKEAATALASDAYGHRFHMTERDRRHYLPLKSRGSVLRVGGEPSRNSELFKTSASTLRSDRSRPDRLALSRRNNAARVLVLVDRVDMVKGS